MVFFAFSFQAQAQKVTFTLKNTSTEQVQFRMMQGNKQIASGRLNAKTNRTDQRPAGASVQINCKGKWISVGSVSKGGKVEISCN